MCHFDCLCLNLVLSKFICYSVSECHMTNILLYGSTILESFPQFIKGQSPRCLIHRLKEILTVRRDIVQMVGCLPCTL